MKSKEWLQWLVMKLMVIVFLLVAIIFDPPYGYFQLMRIILMWIFLRFALKAYEEDKHVLSILCGCGFILFQPLEKLEFNRWEWQVIDQWVILLMIIWCFIDVRKYKLNNR